MGIVSSVSNIYVYNGTLAGLYAGSLVNAGLLNNLGAAGVGSFTDNNGLLSTQDTAETLFSLNGGPAEEITYHGSGTVAMIGLFGIQLDSRPVAVFSSGGQTYLYAPQGLPVLSALSVSFDINPTASFALPVTPVDGVVQGMDSSEAMSVGYTDLQGDRITDGNDIIEGNGGNDTITAGGGDDLVYGGSGNDVLRGGTGRYTLFGGAGNDCLSGGAGNDVFVYTPGDGADTISDFNFATPARSATATPPPTTSSTCRATTTISTSCARISTTTASSTSPTLRRTAERSTTPTTRFSRRATRSRLEPVARPVPDRQYRERLFTAGTRIPTVRGNMPVEHLREGNILVTRDRGLQAII